MRRTEGRSLQAMPAACMDLYSGVLPQEASGAGARSERHCNRHRRRCRTGVVREAQRHLSLPGGRARLSAGRGHDPARRADRPQFEHDCARPLPGQREPARQHARHRLYRRADQPGVLQRRCGGDVALGSRCLGNRHGDRLRSVPGRGQHRHLRCRQRARRQRHQPGHDAANNLVFSDTINGPTGFAFSSFAGALDPGTYTLVATGTAARLVPRHLADAHRRASHRRAGARELRASARRARHGRGRRPTPARRATLTSKPTSPPSVGSKPCRRRCACSARRSAWASRRWRGSPTQAGPRARSRTTSGSVCAPAASSTSTRRCPRKFARRARRS